MHGGDAAKLLGCRCGRPKYKMTTNDLPSKLRRLIASPVTGMGNLPGATSRVTASFSH